MIDIQVNGEKQCVDEGVTITALLQTLSLNPERILVEYNKEVCPPETLPVTILQNGDALELIEFVAGG